MNPNLYADEAVRIAERAVALANHLRAAGAAAGALHSPLMGVTNAISSVIVVGAMLAVGLSDSAWARTFGFLGVMLASINIFGGFVVTQRMLGMFQANKRPVRK